MPQPAISPTEASGAAAVRAAYSRLGAAVEGSWDLRVQQERLDAQADELAKARQEITTVYVRLNELEKNRAEESSRARAEADSLRLRSRKAEEAQAENSRLEQQLVSANARVADLQANLDARLSALA